MLGAVFQEVCSLILNDDICVV